jgi:hypothetical protein
MVDNLSPFSRKMVIQLAPRPSLDRFDLARTAESGPIAQDNSEPRSAHDLHVSQQHPVVWHRIGVPGALETEFDSYATVW